MVERLKSSLPFRIVAAYGQSKASNYAAALAFGAFLTMFPLLLGILAIIGFVLHDPATQSRVQSLIVDVFPSDAHAQLLNALHGVKQRAGLMGIISVGGLIWTGTGLFASMEFALTQVFGTKQRDAVRQRVMGFVMMVLFVLAIVVAVAANNAAGLLPGMPVAGFVVGAVVMIALLIAIYRFVPNRTFSLAEVIPGALLAGISIQVLTLVFPLYARFAHGFNTYGQQFALFFLLATWLYFLSQLLLLGAVYNRMRLGAPAQEGIVAAPSRQAEATPRPVEAVAEKKQEAGAEGEDRRPTRRRVAGGAGRPSLGNRVIGMTVAAAITVRAALVRGRRRRRVD